VGIEALSRGAAKALCVEQKHTALRVIRENLKALGIEARAELRHGRAVATIPGMDADIVFLDPPFDLEKEYRLALDLLSGKPPTLVIAQHPPRLKLEDRYGALHRTRQLKQGDNELSFYEP
jgi:16S rRNA G966 N2-methylase RsmD